MKKIVLSENCFGPDVEINGESLFIHEYDNRNLEIANVANNPLIEQIHMLENGNNALHQEFEQFKTGIQTQGNALLHKMNVLEHHKTPLKVLDIKKKAGRPKKRSRR